MTNGVAVEVDERWGSARERREDVLDDFKETEFKTVATLGAYTEIWKNKKTSVFVAILGIFEMVKGRND